MKAKFSNRDVFLLAEEAHADVVPERSAFRRDLRGDAVLSERHVIVTMLLHHTSGRKDRLSVRRLVRQCIAQVFERLLVLRHLPVVNKEM